MTLPGEGYEDVAQWSGSRHGPGARGLTGWILVSFLTAACAYGTFVLIGRVGDLGHGGGVGQAVWLSVLLICSILVPGVVAAGKWRSGPDRPRSAGAAVALGTVALFWTLTAYITFGYLTNLNDASRYGVEAAAVGPSLMLALLFVAGVWRHAASGSACAAALCGLAFCSIVLIVAAVTISAPGPSFGA